MNLRMKKIRDLEAQVRDLMLHFEAQSTLSKQSEFEDGDIVVVPSPSINSTTSPPQKRKSPRSKGYKHKKK